MRCCRTHLCIRYKHNHRMEWLSLPDREFFFRSAAASAHVRLAWDEVRSHEDEKKQIEDNEFRLNHPHLSEWKEVSAFRIADVSRLLLALKAGRQFFHPYHFPPSKAPRATEPIPHGTSRVQVSSKVEDSPIRILTDLVMLGTSICS